MLKSMFDHHSSYSTLRQSLGLQSLDCRGLYEPSSGLIVIHDENSLNNDNNKSDHSAVLYHELHHSQQVVSTTAGIVLMALHSLRSTIFENFVKTLNVKFQSGLWVPILGWLGDVETGSPMCWHDPEEPYYYISYMKKNIGNVDSALFSLGAFESNNLKDCVYWAQRFPWAHLFKDKSWEWCFSRSLSGKGWWPFGLTPLLEASTLYLELLKRYDNFYEVNDEIKNRLQILQKDIGGKFFRESSYMTYYGPFLLCEQFSESEPPFHLVPVAAFWAMNAPLPHFCISDSIKCRNNERDFPWGEVNPGDLFLTFFHEIACDLGISPPNCSLKEFAGSWQPAFLPMSGKRCHVDEIIKEDIEYVEGIRQDGKNCGTSFSAAFSSLIFPETVEDRLEAFFTFPSAAKSNANVAIKSPGFLMPPDIHLEAYVLHLLAQHLIPLWSFRSLPRFRFGQQFKCPAIDSPFRDLCHSKTTCSGTFPDTRYGTKNVPSDCWLQKVILKLLSLNLNRIGIVPGEYASEEEVRNHDW